jgi:general secretion pathway protein D
MQGSRAALSRAAVILLSAALLAGCAVQRIEREARESAKGGDYARALKLLDDGLQRHVASKELRMARLQLQEEANERLLDSAQALRNAGQDTEAEAALRRLLAADPGNARAKSLLEDIARSRRQLELEVAARAKLTEGDLSTAQGLVDEALRIAPRNANLSALKREIELRQRAEIQPTGPRLADTRPITLEFRDANIRMVFEALTRATGVNFVIDKDVPQDARASIFVRNASIEDALNLITASNRLVARVINEQSVLIYPNTPDKLREYQDLLVRGFYLAHASAKQTSELIKTILKVSDIFVDDKLNMLVVRDSPEAIRLVERLVAMHDVPDAEVMLEVEVLEVKSTRLTEIGIKYPDSLSLTPLTTAGTPVNRLNQLNDLRPSRIGINTPQLLLSLRRDVSDVNTLANPKIRAKNRERANILIGDRVPVITTTAGANGLVTENVTFTDVGIKLAVEPLVNFDDAVEIKTSLEVSTIAREVRTASGGVAYQIGTRSATTTLRLQDGETQVLGGLISNAERGSASRIPGLGDLPIAGRLFSTQRDDGEKTEVLLAITPRLIRPARMPDVNITEFWSGSATQLRSRPLMATARPASRGTPASELAPRPAAEPATGAGGGSSAGAGLVATNTNLPVTLNSQSAQLPVAIPAVLTLNAPATAKRDDEIVVALRLSTDAALLSLPVSVQFDVTRLKLAGIEPGDYFGADPAAVKFTAPDTGVAGAARFTLQATDPAGAANSGVLAVLRFKPLTAGPAEIRVREATPKAAGVQRVSPSLPAPIIVTIE